MTTPAIPEGFTPVVGDKCPTCGAEWCRNPHGEIAILHLLPCATPQYIAYRVVGDTE